MIIWDEVGEDKFKKKATSELVGLLAKDLHGEIQQLITAGVEVLYDLICWEEREYIEDSNDVNPKVYIQKVSLACRLKTLFRVDVFLFFGSTPRVCVSIRC